MRREAAWRGGRLESAVRIGAPAGLLFGLIQSALNGSPGRAISAGLFFAVLFGAAMAMFTWRAWPGARALSPGDRMRVVRIVRRGDSVSDARLAPAVIEYAGVVRRAQERDRRFRGVLWVFASGAAIFAVGSTASGHVRAAVVWWALVGVWAVLLVRQPRRRARALERAAQAEAAARRTV